MSFRITGLPAENFDHLFALSDPELRARSGAKERAWSGALPHQPDRREPRRGCDPDEL